MSRQRTFDFTTLDDFCDGEVLRAINAAIRACVNDCVARPAELRDRKVGITVHATPVPDQQAFVTGAHVAFQVVPKFPTSKLAGEILKVTRTGDLVFNDKPEAGEE